MVPPPVAKVQSQWTDCMFTPSSSLLHEPHLISSHTENPSYIRTAKCNYIFPPPNQKVLYFIVY